jgi:hypothetical protein
VTEDQAHEALMRYAVLVPGELLNFAKAMEQADHGPMIDGWPYFLSRPEKWTREYLAWIAQHRPQDGDPGWTFWMDALDAMDNANV